MTLYQVFQPSCNTFPERLFSGAVISTHRTPAAAARKITTSTRRLQRRPGGQSSWFDWIIRAWEDGQPRWLTQAEAEAAHPLPDGEEG